MIIDHFSPIINNNGLNVDVPLYPPYNYIKLDDNKWQLEFAVEGLTITLVKPQKEDLKIKRIEIK